MSKNIQILSDLTVFSKYSKYDKKKKRRETWKELCVRNRNMHLDKYPQLHQEILDVYEKFVIPKKVLPSMRSMQFAGKPIAISNNRIFNCAFAPVDHYKTFSETMFLLLGGTGMGYSVQNQHIEKLSEITRPTKRRRYLVEDSIIGWANSVKVLLEAFFCGKSLPLFDFSDIRPKGALLITSGGKAPGADPLKKCLFNIQTLLETKQNGDKLTSLEAHDIMCYIADAVLSGGIRRAALISLFDIDDDAMLTCKFGNWWELNPQRARANNSVVIMRHRVTEDKFKELWEKIRMSGSGEPGIYFSNNSTWGTNPCCEIALRPYQFCNLTEINANDVTDQFDLESRAKAAAFIGTLQAGYTDFHYLRDIWQRTTEKDSLIGVGMTGIASGAVLGLDLTRATEVVKIENERVAELININKAARTTCVKPSGTTSLVVGSSSGIHAWHNQFYVRRIRFGKNEAVYKFLSTAHPELCEDDVMMPETQGIVSIPVAAPSGSIIRTESALELLERVKKLSNEWVKPGHRRGDNTHNVSATISIKPDEWDSVGNWMWVNKEVYNGLSVLPHFESDSTYKQLPFQDITEGEYNELSKNLTNVDLTNVVEDNDDTNLTDQVACGGGTCEI